MMTRENAEILAVQDAMVADLTPEQRARYDEIMNPHANCPHAPYCAVDHMEDTR